MFRSWRLFAFIGVLVLILLGPLLYSVFRTKGDKLLLQPMKLEWWRMADAPEDLNAIIGSYQALHPNVSVNVKVLRPAEYELALLNAWARDAGPDIVSLPVGDWRARINNLLPAPATVQVPYVTYEGFRNDQVVHKNTTKLPTINDLGGLFADTVKADVVANGKIYGLPLALDTIVTYYNRDLLDAAGVPTPPANWTQLKETVKQVTTINQNNSLLQAGIALGAADNIPRAIDLASLLMMQNGAQMSNANGQAAFHLSPSKEKDYFPGLEALKFYTDFADPIKEVYTWNDTQPDAFEAFVAGQVAMFYGYAYYLPLIKTQAPKLDLGVTGMTQIEGSAAPVNYTDYWVQTVSHKNKSADAAWGFLTFAARQGEVDKYLNLTRRPTALRGLVEKQKADPELAVFANQILNATHWYHGRDVLKMEEYFKQMIKELPASAEPLLLMEQTAAKINQTL